MQSLVEGFEKSHPDQRSRVQPNETRCSGMVLFFVRASRRGRGIVVVPQLSCDGWAIAPDYPDSQFIPLQLKATF